MREGSRSTQQFSLNARGPRRVTSAKAIYQQLGAAAYNLVMETREPNAARRKGNRPRIRRIVELATAAALIAMALYFPTTNTGRAYLLVLVVLFFAGCLLLSKWPSRDI